MIEEFIKEFEELKQYKHLYECQEKDKQKMSDKLYELMMEKYDNESYESRCRQHKTTMCSCCRYKSYCTEIENLPKDIMKPCPSDKAWMPSKVGCGRFEWS
jgi:hypothetical protein